MSYKILEWNHHHYITTRRIMPRNMLLCEWGFDQKRRFPFWNNNPISFKYSITGWKCFYSENSISNKFHLITRRWLQTVFHYWDNENINGRSLKYMKVGHPRYCVRFSYPPKSSLSRRLWLAIWCQRTRMVWNVLRIHQFVFITSTAPHSIQTFYWC